MLDSLDVVIPTPLGLKRGRLGGPVGAAGATGLAVVLLDESAAHPLVDRVFTELGSYLQAAGAVVVRVPSPELPGDPLERLCALVGAVNAVTAAGSLGPRRVAVALAAPEAATVAAIAGAKPVNVALAGLVGLAAAGSRTGAQLALSLARLTGAVRAAADCVAAMATVLVPDTAARRRRIAWGTAPTLSGLGAPSHLVLALPPDDGSGRAATALISELYTWALAAGSERGEGAGSSAARAASSGARRPANRGDGTTSARETSSPGGRGNSRDDGAATQMEMDAEESSGRWQGAQGSSAPNWLLPWLEERWRAIVGELELRNPAAGALAHAAGKTASGMAGFHALRAARGAWGALDVPARIEWLCSCSQGFRAAGLPYLFDGPGDATADALA